MSITTDGGWNMKVKNLFFSLLTAFVMVFSVMSCKFILEPSEEKNQSSFFTLAIRSSDFRSARSSSSTYTPVDIVTNFTESQFRETVTKFTIKINDEPEITAAIGSAVESREEYPVGSLVTVSYTAYGNIRFSDASAVGAISSTTKEVVIASETQTVTVEAGGTNVYFNVKKGLKNADPYTVNTYDITYQPNSPDPSQSPSGIPGPQTDIKENTVAQISSQTPSISGYGFSYWLGNDGKKYNPGEQVTLTKDLILLAQWTPTGGDSPAAPDVPGGDSPSSPDAPPSPADERDIYVSASGNNSNDGTLQNPFETIGKAVEVISGYTKQDVKIYISGDTVEINQTVELNSNKNITIESLSRGKILRANGFTAALFNVRQGSLTLTDITVDGNKDVVQNVTAPLILVDGGTLDVGEEAVLQNNKNTDMSNGGGAIRMTSGTLTIGSDSSITSNEATWGGGIYVTGGTVTIPTESVISGNTATSDGAQIYLFSSVTYNGSPLDAEKKVED